MASQNIGIGAWVLCASLLCGVETARAQCFGGDQLDYTGVCCQLTPANLPVFPQVSLPGLGVCWTNCVPTQQRSEKVDWSQPIQTACGQYVCQLNVTDIQNGQLTLTGPLVLDYTRTWVEVDPQGQQHQVWRFAAKADLAAPLVGIIPACPAPSCLPPFGTAQHAFFYGYVDYVKPCFASGQAENVLVLYHACDFFIHNPSLSAIPGNFHPHDAYAIVAPHSINQPFLVQKQPAPSGPVFGEATRDVFGFLPPICFAEDPITTGSMTKLAGFCFCAPSTAPKHHTLRQFSGSNLCIDPVGFNGGFQSLNFAFPTLPWFHLTSAAIGVWTNPNRYPGTENAWVDEGLFLVDAPCQGNAVEVYYGGTTDNGWTPLLPIPILADGFTDLASNYSVPISGPYTFPVVGTIQSTNRLIYVNTP